MGALADAALSPEAEVLSCAECRARLGSYLVVEPGADEPAATQPLVAAHLATCSNCAADLAHLTAALAGLRSDSLPHPPRIPAPDLTFLPPAAVGRPWWVRLAAGLGLSSAGGPAWGRAALAGAAAVLVMLLTLWALAPGRGSRQVRLPPAMVTATAAAALAPGIATPTPMAVTAAPLATDVAVTDEAPARGPTQVAVAGTRIAPPSASPTVPAALPTSSPALPAETAVPPTPPVIVLGKPSLLPGGNGLLRFGWSAPPLVGDTVFDVRVCRGADCVPGAGLTNVRVPSWVWCPTQGAGTYRWQVAVIDGETKDPAGPESAVGAFGWSGGSCAATSEPRPTPTPDYTPTPGPEP